MELKEHFGVDKLEKLVEQINQAAYYFSYAKQLSSTQNTQGTQDNE